MRLGRIVSRSALPVGCAVSLTLACAGFPDGGIRRIDFKNFAYVWSKTYGVPSSWHWISTASDEKVRLVKGRHRFVSPEDSDEERERDPIVTFDAVTYGDLDGDGTEEAAVWLNYGTGGTANWDYLYIYRLQRGAPKLMGRLRSGSRGSGGLVDVAIKDGLLILDFADRERRVGDCCSEGFIRVRYRWRANHFEEQGPRERGDLKIHESEGSDVGSPGVGRGHHGS